MGINMYTFICEDSPNGIFSGIYDAWDFKVNQNKKYPAGSTATDTSSAYTRMPARTKISTLSAMSRTIINCFMSISMWKLPQKNQIKSPVPSSAGLAVNFTMPF